MWMYWIMPLGVTALTLFAGWLNNRLAFLSRASKPISGAVLLELLGALYGTFIGTIVKQCLLPFECEKHPNGKYSLAAMPDVQCYVGAQRALMPIALFFFGVHVIMYFGFVVYVSHQVPTWTQNEAMEMRFSFVYADFRSESYWWGPVVALKELLSAATVSIFPGQGGNQVVFTTFVNVAYFASTLHFQPFPGELENYLDGLAHAGMIMQTVFSLNFAVGGADEASSEDGFCTSRFGYPCASLWLLALQLTFTVLPGILTVAIMLKTYSKRFARLSDKREEVEKLLQDMQLETPHRAWADEVQQILSQYNFDEVEVSAVHETLSAFAVREDSTSVRFV